MGRVFRPVSSRLHSPLRQPHAVVTLWPLGGASAIWCLQGPGRAWEVTVWPEGGQGPGWERGARVLCGGPERWEPGKTQQRREEPEGAQEREGRWPGAGPVLTRRDARDPCLFSCKGLHRGPLGPVVRKGLESAATSFHLEKSPPCEAELWPEAARESVPAPGEAAFSAPRSGWNPANCHRICPAGIDTPWPSRGRTAAVAPPPPPAEQDGKGPWHEEGEGRVSRGSALFTKHRLSLGNVPVWLWFSQWLPDQNVQKAGGSAGDGDTLLLSPLAAHLNLTLLL